jgi:hypothetical protein
MIQHHIYRACYYTSKAVQSSSVIRRPINISRIVASKPSPAVMAEKMRQLLGGEEACHLNVIFAVELGNCVGIGVEEATRPEIC